MKRNITRIIGKRIKSDKRLIMYRRFPESPDIEVLPAGRPSPVITSYLPTGWFQLKGEPENMYLKDEPDKIEIVEPGAKDESALFGRVEGAVSGFFSNVGEDVTARAGYLGEGFTKSIDELKVDAFGLGKYVKQIALVLGVFLIIILINNFVK